MATNWSRRSLLKLVGVALPAGPLAFAPKTLRSSPVDPQKDAAMPTETSPNLDPVSDLFPTQPPELVREMVTVAHFDLNRVKELVDARPSLARASWDWGFGDWEDALGAASHIGN